MGKFQDLTGQTFGYWTVVEKDSSPKSKQTYWICRCECCPYFDENDEDSCPCWNLLHN